MFSRCDFFYVITVTPLHIGTGRSPGIVDLPVARDGFDIPFIPGSSLKGSLKSICLRSCVEGKDLCECRKCRRVYGWDLRVEDQPSDAYMSPTVFSDAFLALYPVRVEHDSGYQLAYATSLVQLARLLDALETCSALHTCDAVSEAARVLRSAIERASNCTVPCSRVAFFNNIAAKNYLSISEVDELRSVFNALNKPIVPALAKLLYTNGVYVFLDEEEFREVVEAGMVRQTRIRLDVSTKTVATSALWTEEYVPQGAVFAAPILYRYVEHSRAADPDEAQYYTRRLLRNLSWTVVIGGKETIGKGVTRLVYAC